MSSVHCKGYSWWQTGSGQYECMSARVFRAITGTWAFVAKYGHHGKRRICWAIGNKTRKAAMDRVNITHERALQKRIRKLRKYERALLLAREVNGGAVVSHEKDSTHNEITP